MKRGLVYLSTLILLAGASVGGYFFYKDYKEKQDLKNQLADVELKIQQLPELEEDIFAKCMEGKSGTSSDLRSCQESTQRAIFTLSQDLSNLKLTIEAKL
ncbi:hypothetical protein HYS84_00165 [Candidatus Saccharibacteria bacterium]|nr:hypothetical protein [Candidatus Saccharibacteria bacterium]